MKTWLREWVMCGVAALAAGCTEQYQQHDPDAATADVAVTAADVARDAGSSRLMGVDPVIREAFDGRGATPGPVTSLEGEGGNIHWPRGMSRLVNVEGRMVLAGSGVQPGARWAVPVLRFTPHEDGTTADRLVTWLSLGMGDYRPTEISSVGAGDRIVVCSRNHWSAEEPNDRDALCGVIQTPQGTPSLARQVTAGSVLGVGTGRAHHLCLSFAELRVNGSHGHVPPEAQGERVRAALLEGPRSAQSGDV